MKPNKAIVRYLFTIALAFSPLLAFADNEGLGRAATGIAIYLLCLIISAVINIVTIRISKQKSKKVYFLSGFCIIINTFNFIIILLEILNISLRENLGFVVILCSLELIIFLLIQRFYRLLKARNRV